MPGRLAPSTSLLISAFAAFAAFVGCRHAESQKADASAGPTTTRVRVYGVECSHPRPHDYSFYPELTGLGVETLSGYTDIHWDATRGCSIRFHPTAKIKGNQIVIEPNFTRNELQCCPVQETYLTRIPNLPAGSYDLLIGERAFHFNVPGGTHD